MKNMESSLASRIFIFWCIFCCPRVTSSIKDDKKLRIGAKMDYKDALSKSILFFEGQRSGKLPSSQRVKWRGDSALSDGSLENVNLIGGYYDAGDNVKFTWPMAFSLTLLSWAATEFRNEINWANELDNLQTAIRWGTDFLLQAHTHSNGIDTLYTQVGDANGDHQCWERPEDMDIPRTLYKINNSSPGSEAAADVAAALASASIVFKNVDSEYSDRLLNHARLLFDFADMYRGSYRASCPFYCPYLDYKDELLWAAAWLYKATGNQTYMNYVTANERWSLNMNEFSWDNKFAGAQTLLAKEYLAGSTSLANYKSGADSFVCSLMPGSSLTQIRTTPGGLLFLRNSSNLQYATSASMILMVYSRTLQAAGVQGVQCGSLIFSTSTIRNFAKSQVDYILGNNPLKMSYMVGFGSKYPTQIHHRGASIPSIQAHPAKVGCNDGTITYYSSSIANPNTHVGAIVGGPNSNDQFNDSRSYYSHLEPTTYIDAAFVGSVAALLGLNKEDFSNLEFYHTNYFVWIVLGFFFEIWFVIKIVIKY